jgi:tetratricopeptide (TPR) repeat protein
MVLVSCVLPSASSMAGADTSLDRVFASYAGGDYGVIAKTFTSPADFQPLRLDKPQIFANWLGAWNAKKAAFTLELARTANDIAPTKTYLLIAAGQRYFATNSLTFAATPASDAFERTWHLTALGLLQRHGFADYEDTYLNALQRPGRQGANQAPLPDRLGLARGIAQEQRCWVDRASLDRAGDAADTVARAAGQDVKSTDGVSKSKLNEAARRRSACWSEAITRFTAVFDSEETSAEARLRAAWALLQLGRPEEALRTLGNAPIDGDPDLAYWHALFQGRINDALGRNADAERAYRLALTRHPDGQSAGIGLALTLFKMDRDVEADALAVQLRTRPTTTTDPWWIYFEADNRFVDRWVETVRGAAR